MRDKNIVKTRQRPGSGIPEKILAKLYRLMSLIRNVELEIEKEYPNDEMKTPVHLCIGQEAMAAAFGACLKKKDYVFSNHRGHGHYMAKGGSVKAMIAELYCKETGCSKGRGGSMHLADTEAGLFGSSSIVGGGIPIAVGAGLAMAMKKTDQVSVAFFGDAAVEEGVFYESVNFAVLKKLPVIFVCENNFYSVCTPLYKRQASDNIYKKLENCGIPGYRVDGSDVIEAYLTADRCVSAARSGKGPSLIEARAYRWRPHAGSGCDIKSGYRTQEELDRWIKKCPVDLFKKYLLKNGIISKDKLMLLEKDIDKEIKDSFAFAKKSPLPKKEEIGKYLYR